MKEKHIILRSSLRSSTRGPFAGSRSFPFSFEAAPGALNVEMDDMERSSVAALNRDATVVAVAPVMPMKLIQPVSVEDVASPLAQGPTWGVKAVGADTSPFTGDGIVVAVLDTGIDASHLAFSGVQLVQKDFTGEGDGDQHGHGTHCAGTIFGRDVQGTRIGVARGVKKAVIGKVLGQRGGGTDWIMNAILWALDNGANIISMSLGMDFPGYVKDLENGGMATEPATSLALEGYRANVLLFEKLSALIKARAAFTQPAIVVAAAGNESNRPTYEIATAPPAVADGITSVAALKEGTQGLEVAYFSNTGADVSGPGWGVLSAKPGGGLQSMSGTSMATPHVAGVAALWAERIAQTGNLTDNNLIASLIARATHKGLKAGFDPFDVGAGLVRAPQAQDQ